MSTDTTTPPPGNQRAGYPPLSELRRSRSDRKLFGVAGGLGRYTGIDPLVFRILFVVLTLFGGSGLLLYALGWLLMPDDGQSESEGQRLFRGTSRSFRSIIALVVVVVLGIAILGASLGSGPGRGGLVVLVVVAVGALLLSRNGSPPAVQPPADGPAQQPPGEFGQTPGTAYAAAPPPAYPATAPLPPPPGGSGYVASAPAGPPPPPPPPRERSVLGRATLSAALLVVGLLVAWNLGTSSDVPARVVLAAALGVVALGLVVGGFAGRARGLVAWGVLLTVLVAAASAAPHVPVRGGVGDRTWRPATVAELRPTYRLGIGQAELDLSGLDLTGAAPERVEVRQGVGDLLVVVPDGVVVRVLTDVDAGEIRLPGRALVSGTGLTERATVPRGSAPSAAVLVVDARLGVGSLEVRRAAS